jgi:hypothetical protein
MIDHRGAHVGRLARAFCTGCARYSVFACLLLAASVLATPAWAQGEAAPGQVSGRVFDSETGKPIEGATVIVLWPAPADGGEPHQEVQATDAEGAFEFPAIAAGTYRINFVKSGYRSSSIAALAVHAGQRNRADFPLPPLPPETSSDILDLDEFVVEASTVDEMMASLELRMDSDQLVNVMSAEDLSKFAATDVGEALKRVAGVNIVEGQFAIIRGLEDRYSSTLYNSAPVPSPDPDRQSVQLDLFPAEVVDNLVVSKTFAPDLPGNSAGGSIDIETLGYPEGFTFALKTSGGFNENAVFDRFIEFEKGSPVGEDYDGVGPLGAEGGAFLGGRYGFAERELRYKALVNWERDYGTAEGFQEGREPAIRWLPGEVPPLFPPNGFQSGGLSLGELALSNGRFDLTESEKTTQGTGYLGLGTDLDEAGRHKLDGSLFYTKKMNETVQLKENGYFPNFDYSSLAALDAGGNEIRPELYRGFATVGAWITGRADRGESPSRGPLWFTNFSESKSFERKRDLLITQLNGDHQFEQLEGLHVSWAGNYARTTQNETSLGVRYFFEPTDVFQPAPTSFPVSVTALGAGRYASRPDVVSSSNEIEEKQGFGRLDTGYARELSEVVDVEVRTGGWYEHATRTVDSDFLESPTVNSLQCARSPNCTGAGSQFTILGDTPQQMGAAIFSELNAGTGGLPSGTRFTSNESNRTIWAWNAGGKVTFFDQVDALGGIRLENIFIESLNDPFTGENRFGVPDTFPTRYVFWDRVDNPVHRVGNQNFPEVSQPPPATTAFNDEILGIDVPTDGSTTICDPPGVARGCVDFFSLSALESFVNGEIDERRTLPSASIAYRPLAGLALRAAWSKTVARPSFREMGFYVSVEPGTDDLVVGNPQLGLSDVESWDGRVEYVWGNFGDLAALSGFYKTIQNPIESIVVRNPLNLDITSSALFRTFFNNPSEATLWGIEAEARKNLGFVGLDFAEHFTLGGNFTWIEAEVDRTPAELLRSQAFFGALPGDSEEFSSLEPSRRLFGQPKWIVNADLSFDQPDWGTRATLAFFAISDVLDAAGSASIGPDGRVYAFTIDRYIDSFYQLDLILSQTWRVEMLRGDVTLKFTAKNLTDSTRQIIYDSDQTSGEIPERSYKLGRDFKLSLTYSF